MRDAQLIRRIQAGDRTAADTLIERYYTAILRYCARHTPCTQTAEDLTQEVFLHLFRTIGSYLVRFWMGMVHQNKPYGSVGLIFFALRPGKAGVRAPSGTRTARAGRPTSRPAKTPLRGVF